MWTIDVGMVITNSYKNRRGVLNNIVVLNNDKEKPWLTLGDFNSIKSQTEKRGGRPVDHSACREFEEWIDVCEFMELNVTGGGFT